MRERWQRELLKLRRGDLPDDLWDRVRAGPRLEPLPARGRSRLAAGATALAVFAVAAVLVLRAFDPFRATVETLAGPGVLTVPPRGEVTPEFLPDGRPIFLVHHEDGTVSVVDAFSSHRAWGVEDLVVWCPSTRHFVEWAHEAHFDEYGNYHSAGPAPTGLATFAFDVVERDGAGDPASIRVGAMRESNPAGSPPVTDPSRPPFCPPANEFVAHTIDESRVWDSPADAAAADPEGWIAVRGTLLVASDGFVQLCAEVREGRCLGGAIVRGVDGAGLYVNVLEPHPGSGYEKPGVWRARVRDGVIDDPAIGGFLAVE